MRRSGPAPRIESGDAFSWRFVTPLLMGSVLNPVNSSLLATALAPIARAVHVPVGRTAILVSVLYLACVVAQPTAGKLSEEFGPRRVFLVGIVTVLVGGLVGGFGQDLSTLVVARILIGVGTSAGYPSAMLMIRRRADAAGLAEPPGAVLGGLLLAGIGVLTIGFPLGGVLVYAWGWRAMFFVNVPVTLVTLALTAAWIPRDPPVVATSLRSMASRIDVAGVVGFGTAMTLLLVFLLSLPRPAWVVLGAAVLVGTALVAWELRAQRPFVDVRLLMTNLALTRTYIRAAMGTLCIYTVLYGVTEWLEAARGTSAREAGLILLPMSAISAVIVLPMSRRNLVRLPLLLTAGSCLLGSICLAIVTTGTPITWIVAVTLLFGLALGATTSGNQTTLYAQTSTAEIGTASGLLRTFSYMGSVASSAIIAVAFRTQVSDDGLHSLATIMIIASVVALVLVVADPGIMRVPRISRVLVTVPARDRSELPPGATIE
jgi:MFS family permease